MEFKIKPPKKFKLRNIIFSSIFIFAYSISIYATLQKPTIDIDTKINDLFSAEDNTSAAKTDTKNNKNSNVNSKNGTSGEAAKKSSTDSTTSKAENGPVDYSKLTIDEYAKLCVSKTFGEKNSLDKTYFSSIRFTNNCHLVHINIGYYGSSEQLKAAAINASVDLYKSLYTVYPEKFGQTLFGIKVSGKTTDKKGKDTDIEEAAVSWYSENTLKTLDINMLTVDNFKDTVYRFYDYQNMAGIQRD